MRVGILDQSRVGCFFLFFMALPFPSLRSGFGSGASGLPAPRLLRCARVCALARAPYRPLARGSRRRRKVLD
jgi:hypothetical protein